MKKYFKLVLILLMSRFAYPIANFQEIKEKNKPSRIEIHTIGSKSLRVTLLPDNYKGKIPHHPAIAVTMDDRSVIVITEEQGKQTKIIGDFKLEITKNPLTLAFYGKKGNKIQEISFLKNGNVSFITGDSPILGMGEGGPKPTKEVNWRTLPIEFDRSGRYHKMNPRWQSDAYGSRNPVPFLLGTAGWGIFVVSPWVEVDLTDPKKGVFIPRIQENTTSEKQSERNQSKNLGKGLPPNDAFVPGLFDFFVLDGNDPERLMKDIATITGPAVMPPLWAMGYMQSHRTLKDDNQLIEIVDTFRKKEIPLDAVIYLGTGFTPRGWNTTQPSFDFNPEVFKRDGASVIKDLHSRHVKVVMHMVPWDRAKLPTLQGTIPPKKGESLDNSHILSYWNQHVGLVKSGVDAFWPDEGDWFDLFERIKRHQLYYQGPLFTTPDVRPWSLHRNGYLGIAQWGGWVWSGDTQSAWKTLEGQISVGINYSLSISPYWGSDIGGFYPNPEKTGELYARWFQFGAFSPSFRSHGRTWFTSLPWGFGLSDMGVVEASNSNTVNQEDIRRNSPSPEAMNDLTIEPVTKKYAELRYQLLPYNYSLCWEARESGMPLMRALWLHYPKDKETKKIGNEYLWGSELLIAPVYEEKAASREVYLPKGTWYDWWTMAKHKSHGAYITREVDLATMPIYVRAGAIIPFDPVRQYTGKKINEPMNLRVYTGENGAFTLYEDDGNSLDYLNGNYQLTQFEWDDKKRQLTMETLGERAINETKTITVVIFPEGLKKQVAFTGKQTKVLF
tara:strand:- start:32379 stop:34727 length:2349 start_codon:yes stop_codon:yes gene_type:complete